MTVKSLNQSSMVKAIDDTAPSEKGEDVSDFGPVKYEIGRAHV